MDWRGRFQTREKSPTDLVTDADVASQEAIRLEIARHFPSHAFVGEEEPAGLPAEDEYVWIVDPLDGTTNYVHGYPAYAVSVALARGRELLAGVIYDPIQDCCFSAELGQGAWCDGVRMEVTRARAVSESLVAVSLPPRVERDSLDLVDFAEASQACRAVRRSGSAALNLAYVARGWLDAFWATQILPWDVAAGVLMIQEAGGCVTGRDGGKFDLWNPHFLAAATPQLHEGLLRLLAPFDDGAV